MIWGHCPRPEQSPVRLTSGGLAYVVVGECVLRYDNERGKGDHRHVGGRTMPYVFSTPDQLMADFNADLVRWNHEYGRP